MTDVAYDEPGFSCNLVRAFGPDGSPMLASMVRVTSCLFYEGLCTLCPRSTVRRKDTHGNFCFCPSTLMKRR